MPCDFVTVQTYQKIVLVRITKSRLTDAADIAAAGAELQGIIDCHPKVSLLVDLSEVQAMSSQMLAKLVATYKGVQRDKGRMALAGVSKGLMPLFKTTRLHKVFEFAKDPQKLMLLWQRKPL